MTIKLAGRLSCVVLVAFFLSSSTSSLLAQTAGTGALTVTVTDPSGAVISGASVTVTNLEGLSRSTTTGADGSCTFTLL
ncbi:MAG: carboxypeptidase-like regulatory domain-containing protein, partial [Candidatus Acidiferrales bacterium]